jgi:2-O-methyltransferase
VRAECSVSFKEGVEEMDIYRFIRDIHPSVMLEIGVHFGEDTRKFRQMLPSTRIVGFEPDPRNIEIIRRTGIDKLCEFHPVALSDKNEVRTFYMSSGKATQHEDRQHLENDWSSSSSLKRPTGHLNVHPWITFPRTAEVQCMRLDDVPTLQSGIIDFIWADVQGAEDLVFSGAKDVLSRTRYVYTEYATGLYEGQLNRDQLLAMFGPQWSVVHDFGGDILIRQTLGK